jgi:hypothetical protein
VSGYDTNCCVWLWYELLCLVMIRTAVSGYDTNCCVQHCCLCVGCQHSARYYLDILCGMFVLLPVDALLSTAISRLVLYLTFNTLLFRGILEPLLTQRNRKYTNKFRIPFATIYFLFFIGYLCTDLAANLQTSNTCLWRWAKRKPETCKAEVNW